MSLFKSNRFAVIALLGGVLGAQACTATSPDKALRLDSSTHNLAARSQMYKDQDMNFGNSFLRQQPASQTYPYLDEAAKAQNNRQQLSSRNTQMAYSGATASPIKRPNVSSEISGSIITPRKSRVSKSKSGNRTSKFKVYRANFRDVEPINFKKLKPKYYPVHGVDVSRWQYDIDWPKLRRQGANFAYIKSTEGNDHKDPMFRKNWAGAARAGIATGAYHFFYWCSTGASQANWFIRNVPKTKGALPPVIDVEWNHASKSCRKKPSRAKVLKEMKNFMVIVERHYGQKPVIYTAPDFYEDNLQGQFKNYSFWLRSVAKHPSLVYPGRDWAFWQYSGTGKSHGVKTKIDLNVFNGTESNWRKWLAKRTY